jgi:predicted nucleic-acid-binding protein
VISLDTNVFARWIMRDDASQYDVADRVLAESFLITSSVLVELAWVLESVGEMSRAEIALSLATISQLPTANLEDATHMRWAIERFATAGDLADLVHLAGSGAANGFGTFDKRVAKQAGPNSPIPIIDLNP